MSSLPIISLAAFDEADSAAQEAEKLRDACLEHGFFYLKDHGVSPNVVNATLEASRTFFNLPNEVKRQYDHDVQKVYPKTSRGYIPMYGETLHEDEGPDSKEIFDLGFTRPLSGQPFTGPNILPDESIAPAFATAHVAIQEEIMGKVTPKLVRALALALGQEATFFDPYFTEPMLIQRVLHYPGTYSSAGKHTDTAFMTVLIQEELSSPSLRVQSKGEWIDVPCLENTFVINLGDMLQYWTDGLFVSTPHEVKHTLPVSRLSIPFFVYPNIETIFTPFGSEETVSVKEVALKNFDSIWLLGEGAGRAKELT